MSMSPPLATIIIQTEHEKKTLQQIESDSTVMTQWGSGSFFELERLAGVCRSFNVVMSA